MFEMGYPMMSGWGQVPPQNPWWQRQTPPQGTGSAQERQNGPGWVLVPGVADIANVSVQPGVKAWIMAQGEPVFAVKEADTTGITTTSYYKFEKYDPEAAQKAAEPEFVTKAEFSDFLNKLNEQIGGFADE